jgi:hypothetical protein
MKVFTDTNYREQGAGDLVEYLDKEDGLRNRLGEQMSDEEIQAFIEKSEAYDFERQIIISPENGDRLSDEELSRYTRKVMSEFCTDRQTATYCYAIHRDTDHPHTQVAVTGTKRDLWMDREDCEWLRETATEQFHEQHNDLTKEVSQQLEAEFDAALTPDQLETEPNVQEVDPELDSVDSSRGVDTGDGDRDAAEQTGVDRDASLQSDQEPEQEPEQERQL